MRIRTSFFPIPPKADLAAARRLIEKHGYGRRLPELEDAESAILLVAGKARNQLTMTIDLLSPVSGFRSPKDNLSESK